MSDPIIDYAQTLTDARVAVVTQQLADVLPNDLPPDVTLRTEGTDLIFSGTNLLARYASDVRLHGIAMTAQAVLA